MSTLTSARLILREIEMKALALILCACAAAAGEAAELRLKQTIVLPGVNGRIDHLAVDVRGARLFVCALGNNTVEVVDLRKGGRVRSIGGLGAPQGAGYVPEPSRLYIANDKGGIVNIYDGQSFASLGKIAFEDDADNVRYDSSVKRIYVGFGSGGIGIVDAVNGKQIGSIRLSGHPEAFQLMEKTPRMFVNVPAARQVAVVDRDKGEVVATWKIGGASANFPMALDESGRRLFIGCRTPAELAVLDEDTGEMISHLEISGDADDLFYDARRRLLYVVCGAGNIDVIEQLNANAWRRAATIPTAAGARTGLFVREMNSLFVAVPRRGGQAAEIRRYEIQ